MKVYRLEHPETGCGPWQHWNKVEDWEAKEIFDEVLSHCNASFFPNPSEDGVSLKEYMVCGAPSHDVFFEWFPADSWCYLREAGFKMLTLEVPDPIKASSRQVIYDPTEAITLSVEDVPK